jgi:hypothetical protein
MKVWKSPVLYIGVLLVVAVLGALAAPFVIDWNGYRARLETYGEQLTGRKVAIGGDISVRLFPWPRLIVDGVRVQNLPGTSEPDFLTAQRVVVRLALAGLLNGSIRVEQIEAEQPSLTLERSPSGAWNWHLSPAEDIDRSGLLEQVQLDRISVRNGTLRLIDQQRDGLAELRGVELALAAPGINGPWRARGTATYGTFPLDIGINTGQRRDGEPLRFGVRIAPGDGSGFVYSFDGADEGSEIAGELRIEPAAAQDGKGDAEGALRPLVFQSKLRATFDRLAFEKIEVVPRDTPNAATLVSGSADVALGEKIGITTNLSAPRLDIDQLAGAATWLKIRNGDALDIASGLFGILPREADIKGALKIGLMRAGGENIENLNLRLSGNRNSIAVENLSASLPGRSQMKFTGTLAPGVIGAELAGTLSVEANDVRQLTNWLWPEGKGAVAAYWNGDRGRLKLEAQTSASARRLRLTDLKYELDGASGSAAIDVAFGERPRLDFNLDASELDIERYVPAGLALLGPGRNMNLASIVDAIAAAAQSRDFRIVAEAGVLKLNGVEAGNVAVDLTSGEKGLGIGNIDIGSVNGARLKLSGLVLNGADGPDGSVTIAANAEKPQGLLRLLGLVPKDGDPRWAAVLGRTELRATLATKPGVSGSSTALEITGSSGELRYTGSATLSGFDSPAPLTISGSGALQSADSGEVLRLFVPAPIRNPGEPGRMVITVSGRLTESITANVQAALYGASLQFEGKLTPGSENAAVEGALTASSENAGPIWAALGVPAELPAGGFDLKGDLKPTADAIEISGIAGSIAGVPVEGNVKLVSGGTVSGQFGVGRLVLKDVLAAALMPWGGGKPDASTAFSSAPPLGLSGEIWLKPKQLELFPGSAVADAELGWTVSTGKTTIYALGKDRDGRDFRLEVESVPAGESRKLKGKAAAFVNLAEALKLAGGGTVASGEAMLEFDFNAEGRSPGGALTAMNGAGTYKATETAIYGLSPPAFGEKLATAEDAAGLQAAFDALLGSGSFPLGEARGAFLIKEGVVTFNPISVTNSDAEVKISPVAELAEGTIDIGIDLLLKTRPGLPRMEVSYVGAPQALQRSASITELSAFLGYRILEKGVKELERLQAEQKRLAEEEEKMRLEDEARYRDYIEHRRELRKLQRLLKTQELLDQRYDEEQRRKAEQEAKNKADDAALEMNLRVRELRVHRQQRRQSGIAVDDAPPLPPEVVPLPRRKPVQAAKPAPKKKPAEIQVPVVLVPPVSDTP